MSTRREGRLRRKSRIRAVVRGTGDRPRFSVFRSNEALSAQLIDDAARVTLAACTVKGKGVSSGKELGRRIAEAAKKKKISRVVFDRSGYRYHGVVQEIADAAREGGLVL